MTENNKFGFKKSLSCKKIFTRLFSRVVRLKKYIYNWAQKAVDKFKRTIKYFKSKDHARNKIFNLLTPAFWNRIFCLIKITEILLLNNRNIIVLKKLVAKIKDSTHSIFHILYAVRKLWVLIKMYQTTSETQQKFLGRRK